MESSAEIVRAANAALIADGDLDAVERYFTPDYVAHVTEQDISGGHELVRRFVGDLQDAFANLRVDVDILVEGAERVAWQRTIRGVHEGAFRGFAATGREIVWRDMLTSRFQDGRIAEEWAVSDLAERLLRARQP